MYQNKQFKSLVDAGRTIGETISSDKFLVKIKGLDTAPSNSIILFEDGNFGFIKEITKDHVIALSLTTEDIPPGQLAVLWHDKLQIKSGEGLLGRAVNPFSEPLDNKGPMHLSDVVDVFNDAPSIMDRGELSEQLASGVAVVDTLFSIIKGQRIAVLGDSKTGKSSFAMQMAANQKNTDRVMVYVLIGKKRQELEYLYKTLSDQGVLGNTIIVYTNIMDPLPSIYLAPYSACAMAEYFWAKGKDCVIVYDDLSSHAKTYREFALLMKNNPGRESYPGDIFYIHSSLLERAGKIKGKEGSLTAVPLLVTPNNDITGYISTNIISITDGQLFLDSNIFNEGMRPAVNIGLSVSRIAERGRTSTQNHLAFEASKRLAAYREALQFSRFGAKMSNKIKEDLLVGEQIHDFFKQHPDELISLIEQQVVLQAIIMNQGRKPLDVEAMKQKTKEIMAVAKESKDLFKHINELLEVGSQSESVTEEA